MVQAVAGSSPVAHLSRNPASAGFSLFGEKESGQGGHQSSINSPGDSPVNLRLPLLFAKRSRLLPDARLPQLAAILPGVFASSQLGRASRWCFPKASKQNRLPRRSRQADAERRRSSRHCRRPRQAGFPGQRRLYQVPVDRVPHCGATRLDLQRNSVFVVEGVDFVGPQIGAFITEENRTRQLGRIPPSRVKLRANQSQPSSATDSGFTSARSTAIASAISESVSLNARAIPLVGVLAVLAVLGPATAQASHRVYFDGSCADVPYKPTRIALTCADGYWQFLVADFDREGPLNGPNHYQKRHQRHQSRFGPPQALPAHSTSAATFAMRTGFPASCATVRPRIRRYPAALSG